jgi:KipI family sensor histidine kinase inhibitor
VNDASIRVVAFGDAAVLVLVGERLEPAVTRRVLEVARAIGRATGGELGWSAPVPGAASVLVAVDPVEPGVPVALTRLRELTRTLGEQPADDDADAAPPAAPIVELPTRYGGRYGPDLEAVAWQHGLDVGDVIALHASTDYEVQFLGFAPGFAYLGPLPEAIATPRHDTPRTKVAAGSVGIAGRQTAVYPFDSPGGWQIIGRTDARLWDVSRDPPALLVPGTTVRFVPLD